MIEYRGMDFYLTLRLIWQEVDFTIILRLLLGFTKELLNTIK